MLKAISLKGLDLEVPYQVCLLPNCADSVGAPASVWTRAQVEQGQPSFPSCLASGLLLHVCDVGATSLCLSVADCWDMRTAQGLGVQGGRREGATGSCNLAGCVHLSYSAVGLTRDLCIEAMSWDTDSEHLCYLLTAESTYPLCPEPHGRRGGDQVHVQPQAHSREQRTIKHCSV